MKMMNVLNDPWIPVRRTDGKHLRVNLRQFYANAHEYDELEAGNAMEEYALARFLALFSHCVYQPSSEGDVFRLAGKGCFPMQPIHDYINLCKSEGVTFELFDKERPFLQARPDEMLDTERWKAPVAKMDFVQPSGNTPIHRSRGFEEAFSFSVEDCPIKLLAQYVFSRYKAGGYDAPPTGRVAPSFFLPAGRNLFETILFSMPLADGGEDAESPEFWRWDEVIPKRKFPQVSLRQGMIFPSRRIVLSPLQKDGRVHTCFYRPGMTVEASAEWTDDAAAYAEDDGKAVRFPYEGDTASFHEALLRSPVRLPACLLRYHEYLRREGREDVPSHVFVVKPKQASIYSGARRGSMTIWPELSGQTESLLFLRHLLGYQRVCQGVLRGAVATMFSRQNESRSSKDYTYGNTVHAYLQPFRGYFQNYLTDTLRKLHREPVGSIRKAWERIPSCYADIEAQTRAAYEALPRPDDPFRCDRADAAIARLSQARKWQEKQDVKEQKKQEVKKK